MPRGASVIAGFGVRLVVLGGVFDVGEDLLDAGAIADAGIGVKLEPRRVPQPGAFRHRGAQRPSVFAESLGDLGVVAAEAGPVHASERQLVVDLDAGDGEQAETFVFELGELVTENASDQLADPIALLVPLVG
jgi:hypothetical protein